jgi:hypothetical protein
MEEVDKFKEEFLRGIVQKEGVLLFYGADIWLPF